MNSTKLRAAGGTFRRNFFCLPNGGFFSPSNHSMSSISRPFANVHCEICSQRAHTHYECTALHCAD